MNIKTITIITIILALFIGIYFFTKTPKNADLDSIQTNTVQPWIEVLSSPVFELNPENKNTLRELQTGDEIINGAIIKTESGAFANIYMQDGSLIRIDENTELILTEQSFDAEEEKLIVKISLSAGKVWSKIFELATPDSLWEVKTSNAVAVVRGTAFGVTYESGKSSIIGFENDVVILVIDPETKELIEGVIIISPGKFIEIKDEDIEGIKEDPTLLQEKIIDTPQEILDQEWIKRSKALDKELEEKKNIELGVNLENKEVKNKELPIKETVTKEPIKTKVTPDINIEPTPQSLALETVSNLDDISEGDVISFKAIFSLSDGTKKDVTSEPAWQVIGQIGAVTNSGVFTAKLGTSVVELGESFGSIVATWNSSDGETILLGQTQILNVKATVEIIEQRG